MATNFEFYKDEIIDWLRGMKCAGYLVADIKGADRQEFCTGRICGQCREVLAALLVEEYIEQPKLTKRERAFCEAFKDGYFVKDKDGRTVWFGELPRKSKENSIWITKEIGDKEFIVMPRSFGVFSSIKWEDEKPWAVEDLLKLDVIDEVQHEAN